MAKRVLVIEDEQDILECIEIILSSSGYTVKTSLNGVDVNRKIQEFLPDLILLDIMLGPIDGREVCRMIKSNQDTKNIPVLMVSAHPDVRNTIEDCGANDFISKPFDIDNLLHLVEINIGSGNIIPGIAC